MDKCLGVIGVYNVILLFQLLLLLLLLQLFSISRIRVSIRNRVRIETRNMTSAELTVRVRVKVRAIWIIITALFRVQSTKIAPLPLNSQQNLHRFPWVYDGGQGGGCWGEVGVGRATIVRKEVRWRRVWAASSSRCWS